MKRQRQFKQLYFSWTPLSLTKTSRQDETTETIQAILFPMDLPLRHQDKQARRNDRDNSSYFISHGPPSPSPRQVGKTKRQRQFKLFYFPWTPLSLTKTSRQDKTTETIQTILFPMDLPLPHQDKQARQNDRDNSSYFISHGPPLPHQDK